jgi:hypothetical protein
MHDGTLAWSELDAEDEPLQDSPAQLREQADRALRARPPVRAAGPKAAAPASDIERVAYMFD